jgi:hypothetical protein
MRRGVVVSTVAMIAARAVGVRAQEPVVVDAQPASFQVVRVPAPAGSVALSVTTSRGFRLVGDTARTVSGREVLLSLMVPGGATAGRNRAATVRFRTADGATRDVAIDMVVPRRRGLAFAIDHRQLAVLRGDRFEFAFGVTNTGNAPDTVQLRLALPPGWRGDESQGSLVLAAGASAQRSTRLTLLGSSATGATFVRLLALAGHDTLGTATATVQVGDPEARAAGAGPTLKLTSAAAGSTSGGAVGNSIEVEGPLDDHVRINASASLSPNAGGQPGLLGLSRLMVAERVPRLMLSSDAWRLQLGTAGVSLSDLAGTMVGGTGASFERTSGTWRGASILARPGYSSQGELFAGNVATMFGPGRSLSLTVSHIADATEAGNRLDAIAGDMVYPTGQGMTFSGGIAERRYRDGSGLGWQTDIRRDAAGGSVELRAATAPGGSAAFARALHELNASASQMIGQRVSIAAAGWRTSDSSMSWRSLDVSGWSLRPSVRLGHATNIGVEARQSSFSADGTTGRMSNDEFAVSANADVRAGPVYATGNLTTASTSRDAAVSSVELDTRGNRAMAQGTLGIVGVFGRAELTATGDRSPGDLGLAARQLVYGANLSDVRLVPWSRRLTGRVAARRYDWFGDQPSVYAMETAIDANLPHALRVSLEADHDPFILSAAGAGKWMLGLRVETGLSLPRLGRHGDAGVVYRDLNGNGVQDRSEPGVGGVLVRRGAETTITHADGSFEFATASADPIAIDTRSLPAGLVPPPVSAQSHTRRIGLISVAEVQVRFSLPGGDADRVSSSDLLRVSLVARDADGKAWLARVTAPDVRVFDALPPGRYTFDVDASHSAEPLHADPSPTLQIVDGASPPAPTITLHARSLKIKLMSKETP